MKTSAKSEKLSIKFGGLWQEFHENIINAEDKRIEAEKQLGVVERERDNLRSDLTILSEKFEAIMGSLTDASTSHMDQKQIIHAIREEKEELKNRCISLESQREWLEKGNRTLKKHIDEQDCAAEMSAANTKKLEKSLEDREKDIQILKHKLAKNEDIIQQLRHYVEKNKQDAIVFHKAVVGKDKQMQTILRERNRLRDELDRANKALKNPLNIADTSSTANAENSKSVNGKKQESSRSKKLSGNRKTEHNEKDDYDEDEETDTAKGTATNKGAQLDDLMREYGNPWSGGSDTQQKMAVKVISTSSSSPLRSGREQPTHTDDVLQAMGRIRRPRSAAGMREQQEEEQQQLQMNGAAAEDIISAAKDRERVYQDAIKRLKVELASARSGLAVAIEKNKKLQSDKDEALKHHHHHQQQQQGTVHSDNNITSATAERRDRKRRDSPSAVDIVAAEFGPLTLTASTPTAAQGIVNKSNSSSSYKNSNSNSTSNSKSDSTSLAVPLAHSSTPLVSSRSKTAPAPSPPSSFSAGEKVDKVRFVLSSPATVADAGVASPAAVSTSTNSNYKTNTSIKNNSNANPVRTRSASCDRRTARLLSKQKSPTTTGIPTSPGSAKPNTATATATAGSDSGGVAPHTKSPTKSVHYKTPVDNVPSHSALASDNPFRVNYYNPW